MAVWAPVKGNAVRVWSKRLLLSENFTVTEWHVAQPVPSDPLWTSAWHDAHDGDAVRNDRDVWQAVHVAAIGACSPSSAKPVCAR